MDNSSPQKDDSSGAEPSDTSDVAKAPNDDDDDAKKDPSGLATTDDDEDDDDDDLDEVLRVTRCDSLNADAATTESTYTVSLFVKEPKLSTTEGVIKDVPALPSTSSRMGIDEVFDEKTGLPLLEVLKGYLLKGELPKMGTALKIINDGAAILRSEPNVVRVNPPVTVCGDVHGQFFDLLKLFEVGGKPSGTNYLFLGDYVDRGCFGIEVVLYLWALKLNYPRTFFLLRGSHECRQLTEYFTFKRECEAKYTLQVYEACMSTFDCLPLAAVMNERFFCVHGGLSPDIFTPSDIERIDRFQEPPSHGPMCDLLWSNPCENYGLEKTDQHFVDNKVRGCSKHYSYDAVCSFLVSNHLIAVVRAHEVQNDGYITYRSTSNNFPSLITIFSAPNYLDIYRNKASVLRYANNEFIFIQYRENPHPDCVLNFMNAFDWSMLFPVKKVTLLNICSEEELNEPDPREEAKKQQEDIRNKVLAVSKMAKESTDLREILLELKRLLPGGALPRGALPAEDSLKSALRELTFHQIRELDAGNECMPPEHIDPEEKKVQKFSVSLNKRLEALVHDASANDEVDGASAVDTSEITASFATSQDQSRENPTSLPNLVVQAPSLSESKESSSPSTSGEKDKPAAVSPKSLMKQLSVDVAPTSESEEEVSDEEKKREIPVNSKKYC